MQSRLLAGNHAGNLHDRHWVSHLIDGKLVVARSEHKSGLIAWLDCEALDRLGMSQSDTVVLKPFKSYNSRLDGLVVDDLVCHRNLRFELWLSVASRGTAESAQKSKKNKEINEVSHIHLLFGVVHFFHLSTLQHKYSTY